VAGIPQEDRPALEGFYWHGRSASLLPADGGLRVAGVMELPGSWERDAWHERLLQELRRFPALRERLRDASVVSRPVSVSGLRNVWRSAPEPGLLLIGDAAVQTDPLFGQGISWALRSGDWAAAAIADALDQGDVASIRRRYEVRCARTLGPRFLAMSTLSRLVPGSMSERLLIANATVNPAGTSLFLRAILGFATVSRDRLPRRSIATWVREAIRG
jgi:flavin-dependent dehydrogenase